MSRPPPTKGAIRAPPRVYDLPTLHRLPRGEARKTISGQRPARLWPLVPLYVRRTATMSSSATIDSIVTRTSGNCSCKPAARRSSFPRYRDRRPALRGEARALPSRARRQRPGSFLVDEILHDSAHGGLVPRGSHRTASSFRRQGQRQLNRPSTCRRCVTTRPRGDTPRNPTFGDQALVEDLTHSGPTTSR